MSIQGVSLENSLDKTSFDNPISSAFEMPPSLESSPTPTPRSSMRRLRTETSPLEKEEHFKLEEKSDLELAESENAEFPTEYARYGFFLQIANQYAQAAALAIAHNCPSDAARILEKYGTILFQKLNNPYLAEKPLLQAWDLYHQIENEIQALKVSSLLHQLADQEIARCRLDGDVEKIDELIDALLLKAEVIEKTNGDLPVEPFYEEAGELSLTLFEQGGMESEGITNAIIAGLCFDKIGIRQNLAKIMYKKTLELAEIQLAILKEQIDDEIISPEDVDGDLLNILWDGCALSSAYSQMAFLSLKCEDKDLFADLVERQVNLWIPVYNSLSNTSFDLICGWIQMFINVGEIILGSDHPTIAKLNAVAEPYISSLEQREQSPELQEVQERILSFYTSSRNTPVKEIICQLKEHLDPRSMLELLAASFASKEREKDVIPNS